MRFSILLGLTVFLAWAAPVAVAEETLRSDRLLPNTTKAYLSIPSVEKLREKFGETQLGELLRDPLMKPCIVDLRRQIDEKFGPSAARLGITWQGLERVFSGEACFAAVQPEGDKKQYATVLLVDAGARQDEAVKLLQTASKNLAAKEAKKTTRKIGGIEISVFTHPKNKDEAAPRQTCHALVKGWIVATDHLATAEGIVRRFEGDHTGTLSDNAAYRATFDRCEREMKQETAHVRFFVEPWGYAEVARAASGGRRARGKDLLKALMNQGFTAVRGVGGNVVFGAGEHELVYRAFVFAPGVPRKETDRNKDKYDLAARMLNFPETDDLLAPPWVPRQVATLATFNFKFKDAFKYMETFIDEYCFDNDKGAFDDLIHGIINEPTGPRIDVRRDLIGKLGERATLLTGYRLPIGPKSERLLLAIELTDSAGLAKTIDRAMESDHSAKKRVFEGHIIWEISNEIENPKTKAKEDEPKRALPNSVVTVADGRLVIGSHLDFIVDLLKKTDERNSLAESADYKEVNAALAKLGAGRDSLRTFSRTDDEYRPTYELVRQGKMPEAETLLAKVLNRLLGPDEEGVLREQQIDGSKMPEFDLVRRYLGPSGTFTKSEADGWFITGCLLTKS